MQTLSLDRIVAVALNPAIDRILEVPRLTIGAHQQIRLLGRSAAGKAVNVARALSVLEVPAVLTGLVGREEQGAFSRDLQGTQVEMRMLPVAGQTRENITLVDPATKTETHLRDRGFDVSADELAAMKAELRALAGPGTAFVFSGSLPPGITPADQAEMVRICRSGGGEVAVDASGPALAAAVEAGPWLIKPNRQELEELLGRTLAGRAGLLAAGRQLARTIPLVLVSCGAEGAYLFTSDEVLHGWCEVPAEQLVSTVGCGDALLTGFVAGVYKNMALPESLRLGLAAATATATNLAASFERERFDQFLPKVGIAAIQN